MRVFAYLMAFVALPLGVGYLGLRSTLATYLAPAPAQPLGRSFPTSPELDQDKPTVAVVLGNAVTEVADTLAPYVTFKTAGAFNVVTVAERRLPVALSGGLSLAAVYDTYGLSFALSSVASPGVVVTTRHGLHLVARHTPKEWSAAGGTLLSGRAEDQRFAFDAALEDVARRQNIPTAEFAAKRLEYRAAPALHGRGWAMVGTLYRPLLLGLLGLVVVFMLERLATGSTQWKGWKPVR